MKPTSFLVFATGLFLLAPLKSISTDPEDSKFPPPSLSVEEALTLAKAYVQDHHVNVSHHYIDSVKFEPHPTGETTKYWLITWLDNRYAANVAMKGGQHYVRVYLDKTVKFFRGE